MSMNCERGSGYGGPSGGEFREFTCDAHEYLESAKTTTSSIFYARLGIRAMSNIPHLQCVADVVKTLPTEPLPLLRIPYGLEFAAPRPLTPPPPGQSPPPPPPSGPSPGQPGWRSVWTKTWYWNPPPANNESEEKRTRSGLVHEPPTRDQWEDMEKLYEEKRSVWLAEVMALLDDVLEYMDTVG